MIHNPFADSRTGPHSQDMAIAASAYDIPAYVVSQYREASGKPGVYCSRVILAPKEMRIDSQQGLATDPITQEKAVKFPLHHHREIIHGQGTVSLQLEQDMAASVYLDSASERRKTPEFGAVISDMDNGCTLSGICMAFSGESTQVFGAAPSSGFWTHASDHYCQVRVAHEPSKSTYWKDVEIPMGAVPWSTFTSSRDLSGVFDVDHEAMCSASRKVFEFCGVQILPDEAAPLAVVLFNDDFRRIAAQKSKNCKEWIVGVILQPRQSPPFLTERH